VATVSPPTPAAPPTSVPDLPAYVTAYEQETRTDLATPEGLRSLRAICRERAERLARALRGEEPYRGFRLPCS
jgi:hypothetical protein